MGDELGKKTFQVRSFFLNKKLRSSITKSICIKIIYSKSCFGVFCNLISIFFNIIIIRKYIKDNHLKCVLYIKGNILVYRKEDFTSWNHKKPRFSKALGLVLVFKIKSGVV